MPRRVLMTALAVLSLGGGGWLESAALADNVAPPSQDLRAGGDANKRYFLIGPRTKVTPAEGYNLLVAMPGGDGSAEFHPFVRNIAMEALPPTYLVAQPVAVKWTPAQRVVWPTRRLAVEGQQFSTEEFVEAVIEEVAGKHPLNKRRIFTLSWSSSGPAAYAISLQKDTAVTGSFIAMSVFRPEQLPSLSIAKGRGYYIYHSPQDRVCPFRMAQQAQAALKNAGAKVLSATYQGGHGWTSGAIFEDIGKGIRWLEASAGGAERNAESAASTQKAEGLPAERPGAQAGQ